MSSFPVIAERSLDKSAMKFRPIIPNEPSKTKQKVVWAVALTGFLSAAARIATAICYLVFMPRIPDPLGGRVYRTTAAFNTGVYVTKAELGWVEFLNYDLIAVVGLGVVLMAVFVLIPRARREGQL